MRSDAVLLLKKLVDLAGGPLERGYVLALEGEGLDEIPSEIHTRSANYLIHRPRTELEIRRLLWKSNGAPFIALVPEDLARRLPPDIVRRAQGARVQALDPIDVLGTVLGVRLSGNDDPELLSLALAHVHELKGLIAERTLPTVIDRRLLDELVIDACVDRRVRSEPPARLLALWLQSPPTFEPALLALLKRMLPVLHGHEGRLLAWALEAPARLQEIVTCGLLLNLSEKPGDVVWGDLLWTRNHPKINLAERPLRESFSRLAEETIVALGAEASPWLLKAEERGRRVLDKTALAKSTVLPLGLDNACDEFAQRLDAGEALPDVDLDPLRRHRAASARQTDLWVLREMARLSRFLATPDEVAETVEAHVQRYLRDGAFADLTAARLRRALAATVTFQHPAERLLTRYRARRDALNLAFAQLLAGGYQRALHAHGVIPLHRLWRDLALPASTGGLFVVVMDGCSYPVFLDLLDELARLDRPTLGLKFNRADRAAGEPALAPLPTITSHARGAIFLGEVPKDPWAAETLWRDTEERVSDPARFRQNPALGDRTRKLFLKAELADGGVALRAALRDPAIEIVSVVFNAIDDQIGSANTGAMVRVEAASIGGFVPSLREALGAGRKVLLVADHGHSPWWGRDLRVGAGATPRFKELAAGEDPPEGWIELDLQGLGGRPGRWAFAWKMGSHQGSPQVGFHGGCSLEEMVVPMAWIEEGGLTADEPTWWFGATRTDAPAATPTVPTSPRKPKPTTRPVSATAPQPELFTVAGAASPRSIDLRPMGLPDAVIATLDPTEQLALWLLARNGTLRARDLAKALAKPLGRISGFMTRLRRTLRPMNLDLFQVETLPDGEEQFRWVGPSLAGGSP
ncbi:MAG: BREX-2 system phosphatase PglZ [Deltaproteobacteria bacterium]|nr:BREX-2 system phosphatase PglZ [Myxococcales bacterium]MDP3220360.1 BREX-2 system phosphatase PglZ [Deltaproteobacteria bacterium]